MKPYCAGGLTRTWLVISSHPLPPFSWIRHMSAGRRGEEGGGGRKGRREGAKTEEKVEGKRMEDGSEKEGKERVREGGREG